MTTIPPEPTFTPMGEPISMASIMAIEDFTPAEIGQINQILEANGFELQLI